MKDIMAHVVAGYPSADECVELMLGMEGLGVAAIEVQIPFSDPIADGEAIMRANDVALKNKVSTAGSFELIRKARAEGLETDVYIMSYSQKLVHFGIEDFCRQAGSVNAKGLIIPDLPFDSPEYEQLLNAAESLDVVPVISPGTAKDRLEKYLKGKHRLVYLTSKKGITGNKLSMSRELVKMCETVRELAPDSTLAIGFGVRTGEDVKQILSLADMAIVGSSVIRAIEQSGIKAGLKLIKDLLN